jgi:hypothetical protein
LEIEKLQIYVGLEVEIMQKKKGLVKKNSTTFSKQIKTK